MMTDQQWVALLNNAYEAHTVAQKRAEAAMRKLLEDDRRRKGACTKCAADMLCVNYTSAIWLRCPQGCTARCVPRSDVERARKGMVR